MALTELTDMADVARRILRVEWRDRLRRLGFEADAWHEDVDRVTVVVRRGGGDFEEYGTFNALGFMGAPASFVRQLKVTVDELVARYVPPPSPLEECWLHLCPELAT